MKRPNITPGPWQISCEYNSGREDGQRIAIICAPHPEGGGQNIAESVQRDSRAIAALPKLLGAMEDLIPFADVDLEPDELTVEVPIEKLMKLKSALQDAGYTFD